MYKFDWVAPPRVPKPDTRTKKQKLITDLKLLTYLPNYETPSFLKSMAKQVIRDLFS